MSLFGNPNERLFGDKYGAGVISNEKIRPKDSLPPVIKHEKLEKIEQVVVEEVEQPVIPLEDLLVTIFGPRYGMGQLSPVNLREISEFDLVQSVVKEEKAPTPPPRSFSPLPTSVDTNEFLCRLFGENYGTRILDVTMLRSKDQLPVFSPSETKREAPRTPTPMPTLNSTELLQCIFGEGFGTGQIDTSKLRSIDDLPNLTQEPTQTTHQPSPPPSSAEQIDLEGTLEKLFGPRYGSGMLDTSLLRSIEDLPKLDFSFAPPPTSSQPVMVEQDEIPREPIEIETVLGLIFGSQYGAGVMDNSKLRSTEDLPKFKRVEKVEEKVEETVNPISYDPIEPNTFLQMLFGEDYGSKTISTVNLRARDQLPAQVVTTLKQPRPPTPEKMVNLPQGDLSTFLTTLFGSHYGSGVVAVEQLRSKSDLPFDTSPVETSVTTNQNEKIDTSSETTLPDIVKTLTTEQFCQSLFGKGYGQGQIDMRKTRPISDYNLQKTTTVTTTVKTEGPTSPEVNYKPIDSNTFLSKLFGSSYGSGQIDRLNLSTKELPKCETPKKTESKAEPVKVEYVGDMDSFLISLFGPKYGSHVLSSYNSRPVECHPTTNNDKTLYTDSDCKVETATKQPHDERIHRESIIEDTETQLTLVSSEEIIETNAVQDYVEKVIDEVVQKEDITSEVNESELNPIEQKTFDYINEMKEEKLLQVTGEPEVEHVSEDSNLNTFDYFTEDKPEESLSESVATIDTTTSEIEVEELGEAEYLINEKVVEEPEHHEQLTVQNDYDNNDNYESKVEQTLEVGESTTQIIESQTELEVVEESKPAVVEQDDKSFFIDPSKPVGFGLDCPRMQMLEDEESDENNEIEIELTTQVETGDVQGRETQSFDNIAAESEQETIKVGNSDLPSDPVTHEKSESPFSTLQYESSSFEMENFSKSEVSSFENIPYDDMIDDVPVINQVEVAREVPISLNADKAEIEPVPETSVFKAENESIQAISTEEVDYTTAESKSTVHAHLHLNVSHLIGMCDILQQHL